MDTPFYLSYAALWVVVVFQSLLLLGLIRAVTTMRPARRQGEQLESGDDAPSFHSHDISGMPIATRDFEGRVTALLFVSPTCSACALTLDELSALRHKAKGNIIVICHAQRDDCANLAIASEPDIRVVVDDKDEIAERFGVSSVPTIVLIGEDGRIQSYGHPVRPSDLEQMISATAAGQAQ